MTANMRTFRMATACLFAASSLSLAVAQDQSTGIVRISDARAGAVTAAGHSKGEYHSPSMGYGDDGYGYGVDGSCPHCQGRGCKQGLKGKFCEHYCTHSACHGYSIPGKWPIHRRGVQYQQLFPNAYYSVYGNNFGPGAPQVYTPTDTTQLGYYYQHVPFWTPQPNPLPARPIPAQWHHYAPVVYASKYQNGYSRFGNGMNGADCPVIYESSTPSATQTPTELQPVPEPVKPAPLPPEPIKESAVPLPLQRASFE